MAGEHGWELISKEAVEQGAGKRPINGARQGLPSRITQRSRYSRLAATYTCAAVCLNIPPVDDTLG